VCDYLRALCTAVLLFDAVVVNCEGAWGAKWVKVSIGLLVVGGTGIAGLPGFIRSRRRMAALHQQLQPIEAFVSPPRPINPNECEPGGLVCGNPDAPGLFVPGPLVLALNLANKRAYLYSAYVAGLVLLVLWVGGIMFPPVTRSSESSPRVSPPGV